MAEPISTAAGGALIGTAATWISQMPEKLGLLERLKSRLMRQPGTALEKLSTVLLEMDKLFLSLSRQINDYSSLMLIPPGENVKGVSEEKAWEIWRGDCKKLREYAAGEHVTPMRHGHGDCKKISWIYDTYLNPWFADVLSPREAEELRTIFRELAESDSYMVDALEETAQWLRKEAVTTHALVQEKSYEDAQSRVNAVWPKWAPLWRTCTRVASDSGTFSGSSLKLAIRS